MSSLGPFPIPVSALKPVSCGSVLWRSAGSLRATFIVKISLSLVHERTAWPTTPLELVLEDRRRDANPQSSLVEVGELAPYLPNAAVILFAHACAPQGRPTPALSARLALFRERSLVDKTAHVFGERAASAPQHPRPFERVPLVYERTWGGPGNDENPVGVAPGAARLPSICDPTNPTKAIGFGPISRQWPQRKRLLGVTDLTRIDAPVADFPNGFDFRYYNAAPLDQQIEHLRGDEWIVLDAMHPTMPRVQSKLPQMRGKVCVYFTANNAVTHNQVVDLVPDMVVIDADKLVASVVFRGSLPLESLDVLPRLRVFGDVELPGNPVRWPEASEVLRAPAPAPMAPTTNAPASSASSIFTTLPVREDSASRPAIPFQPKPPGAPTVVPFVSAQPVRPRVDLDHDPLMRTTAVEPDDSALRPAIPFVAGAVSSAPRSTPPPPPAVPRRPANDDDATRAIDLDKLEAQRAAVTPFAGSASGPNYLNKPEPRKVEPRSFDGEESTRAIDIEQLSAQRFAVTPFAASGGVKPQPAAQPIPGAPWAPQGPTKPTAVAFNIDDPHTHTADDDVVRAAVSAAIVTPSAPPPSALKPPSLGELLGRPETPARVEPPPMVVPPHVSPPEPPRAPETPRPPEVVVPKDPAPPPAVVAPPSSVLPEEPREVSGVAAAEALPPVAASASDETGIRATIVERLRSGVPAPLHDLVVVGADLSGLDMHGANLSGHDLTRVKLCKTNLRGARLGGARLIDADLEGADLENADLAGADLTRATLTNTRLTGANIDTATFAAAQGAGAIFDGAKGRAASFARGQWANASFRGLDVLGADFTATLLDAAVFERAVLPDAKLNDARGKGAKFDHARLDHARVDGATLVGTSFRNLDAKSSVWENATLDQSVFDDACLENAMFVRTTCRETTFVNANLRAANFGRAQGDAANLSGANLEGVDFRQAKFVEAKFEGAKMSNVLAPRADFARSNLSRAVLTNGSLRAAQMGGANLSHAVLDGADLRDADLRRSVLVKASRTGAKLSGANTKDAIEHEPTE